MENDGTLKMATPRDTVEHMSKGKIFVGMSGGVDSSVSAALLKKDGYDVVGVFIKVWQADFLPCTWRQERREAMRAAAHIGIPFLTLDLEEEYKKNVVDDMIREYSEGRVPNPDVMCNKYVKFGGFLEFAKKHGADLIATGHYARVKGGSTPFVSTSLGRCAHEDTRTRSSLVEIKNEDGMYHLYTGVDTKKDQSYFLWTLTQEQLAHTLFPIGGMTKPEVRIFAKKMKLPNAMKKDSQGLCFMGPVDMAEFLKHYITCTQGEVLNEEGNTIGVHEGAMLYTIGQRHGFSTEKATPSEEPYFVIKKDIQKNTITVAHQKPVINLPEQKNFTVKHLNDITGILKEGHEGVVAQIRYRGTKHPVNIKKYDQNKSLMEIALLSPEQYIATGQSIVFYHKNECLGGGIIS